MRPFHSSPWNNKYRMDSKYLVVGIVDLLRLTLGPLSPRNRVPVEGCVRRISSLALVGFMEVVGMLD